MTKAIAHRAAGRAPVKPPARLPTVALALGGGGARGLAHILALEALEELGVRPVAIAGTSIGAIFGAAYASGLSARRLRAHTEEVLSQRFDLVRQLLSARAEPVLKLLNIVPIRSALLNPEALLDLLLPTGVARDFNGLRIPLTVVATDFYRQEEVAISSGPLRPAIAASMALPAIFSPVVREGRALVDGGLVNPLPFDLLKGAADLTIAIDVSGGPGEVREGEVPSATEAVISSSQILQRSIVREKLKATQPDVYIDAAVDNFHVLEFYRFRAILKAAEPVKAELKTKLARLLASAPAEAVAVLPAPPVEPVAIAMAGEPVPASPPPTRPPKAPRRFLSRVRKRKGKT